MPVIQSGCTDLVKVTGIRDLAALYQPDIYVAHRTVIAELAGGTLNNPTLLLQKECPPSKTPWSKWGNRLVNITWKSGVTQPSSSKRAPETITRRIFKFPQIYHRIGTLLLP